MPHPLWDHLAGTRIAKTIYPTQPMPPPETSTTSSTLPQTNGTGGRPNPNHTSGWGRASNVRTTTTLDIPSVCHHNTPSSVPWPTRAAWQHCKETWPIHSGSIACYPQNACGRRPWHTYPRGRNRRSSIYKVYITKHTDKIFLSREALGIIPNQFPSVNKTTGPSQGDATNTTQQDCHCPKRTQPPPVPTTEAKLEQHLLDTYHSSTSTFNTCEHPHDRHTHTSPITLARRGQGWLRQRCAAWSPGTGTNRCTSDVVPPANRGPHGKRKTVFDAWNGYHSVCTYPPAIDTAPPYVASGDGRYDETIPNKTNDTLL